MKKIYIINQYYEPFFAATGQIIKELAEFLSDNNIEVEIITGNNGNKKLKKFEIINNVKINRINNKSDGISYKRKVLSYLSFYWNLLWYLLFKTEKNSVIFSLSTPPLISFVPTILKKIKKYYLIYNIQDLYPDILERMDKKNKEKFIYKISHKISQKILDKSDKLILIGDCMKKVVEKSYDVNLEKIFIIENWALKEIEKYEKKIYFNKNKIKIIYSGNMGRGHEHQTILKCIKMIKENNLKNVFFEFVGGGYNYNILKQEIKEYDFVNFREYVEKENLPEVLNNCDISIVIGSQKLEGIILPSKFYGIVASGKPVIYINSGNDTISNHIENGNLGYKVNNGDYKKLYNIILEVTKNPEKLKIIEKNVKIYYEKNLKRSYSLKKYYDVIKELEEMTR